MKEFLKKLVLFGCLVVVLYLAISNAVRRDESNSNNYTAAIIDKHNRLDQLKGPRIIFAGGSNLAFGLNSETVEKELKLPVVNLGLHAGLGLDFMLNELSDVIREGDIVFLSIEYFLEMEGDNRLLHQTARYFPTASAYFTSYPATAISRNLEDTRNNLMVFGELENNKANDALYARTSFNKYGDLIAHLESDTITELGDRKRLLYRYWDGIQAMNEFNETARQKNVRVFFLYPPFSNKEYEQNKTAINRLKSDLSTDLDFPVLNQPTEVIYAEDLFYNSAYHLNKRGRKLRTTEVITAIEHNKTAMQAIRKSKGRKVIAE